MSTVEEVVDELAVPSVDTVMRLAPSSVERRPKLAQSAAAFAVWAVGMLSLYREVLQSRFERLHGDVGDQRLLIYLSEHWFAVAKGDASWRWPGFFFPKAGVLGYTDTLVAYQPIYAPLRLAGLDPFVSYQLTMMVLSTVGFITAAVFLRKVAEVRFWIALVGAALFAFGNGLGVKVGHSQLYALNLVPIFGLLVASCLRSVRNQPLRAVVSGGCAGLFLAMLFFTTFYIGFFTVLATGVWLACAALIVGPAVRAAVARLLEVPRRFFAVTLAFTGGFALGILPFLATYLPTYQDSGGRGYHETMWYSPMLSDLLNVGKENLVWGGLLQRSGVVSPERLTNIELTLAVTPGIVALTLAGAILLGWRRWRKDTRVRIMASVAAAGVVLLLLPIKVGQISGWSALWFVAPGAKAIRVPTRLDLMTNAVMVGALALTADLVLDRVSAWTNKQKATTAVFALVASILVLEQVQSNHNTGLSHSGEQTFLTELAPAPASCATFFVTDPPPGRPGFASQIDAMLVSVTLGIPTMNGYSGLAPPGWALVDPAAPNYRDAVADWVALNGGMSGVCSFNLSTRQWTAPAPGGSSGTTTPI